MAGSFLPERSSQRKWFEFYCESFNTVELNVTFYRFPRVADLKSWYKRSPEDFMFTVKAPRLITHYKKFNNVAREIQEFYTAISKGLTNKLGSVLFQLHPRTEYSEAKLEQILKNLDKAFVNVIEFRHSSWWRKEVIDALKHNNVTFCSISYPGLPDGFIRLHLPCITGFTVYLNFIFLPIVMSN